MKIISHKLQKGNPDKRIIKPTQDETLFKQNEKKPELKQTKNEEVSRKELFGDLEEKSPSHKNEKLTTTKVGSSIQQTSEIMKENLQV